MVISNKLALPDFHQGFKLALRPLGAVPVMMYAPEKPDNANWPKASVTPSLCVQNFFHQLHEPVPDWLGRHIVAHQSGRSTLPCAAHREIPPRQRLHRRVSKEQCAEFAGLPRLEWPPGKGPQRM